MANFDRKGYPQKHKIFTPVCDKMADSPHNPHTSVFKFVYQIDTVLVRYIGIR